MKRLPHEPLEAFKKRRKLHQIQLKEKLKGKLVWNSGAKGKSGTYKKKK